jgi:chromosomal replication initiator protein
MDDAQFVSALRKELATRIGAKRYELWFTSQAQLCLQSGALIIRAANTFVRDWLRRNFAADLAACGAVVAGRPLAVEFDVQTEENGQSAIRSRPSAKPTSRQPTVDSQRPTDPKSAIRNPQSNTPPAQPPHTAKRFTAPTLCKFAVGPSNEYAFRCAELTAHGRQQAPLVLFWGPTGVGKTHVLRGVLAEYRRRFPRSLAVYLTAEQFTTSFVEAVRGSGLPSFRQKCRGAELLLIDDLQFFVGKQRTVEELHHTIDTLIAAGRQLVLASDRNLMGLRGLGPELSSRLAGGLACEIALPEFATRHAILRQWRDETGLATDDEVLSHVAAHITAGPRELRGALHRLQAISTAWQRPITLELAESALADLVRQATRAVRLSDVEQAVCDVFGCESAALRSERKGRAETEPRMLAMWLARRYTRAPWSEIGRYFGRRSHSTVISAHRRVEKLITSQAQIGVGQEACQVDEAIRRLETALRTA